MKCRSCGKESFHIKVVLIGSKWIELRASCGGFSEAGGTPSDGLLTRNSFRVRHDSVKYEGDTLPPHVYDKHERRFKPREDFIKRFPGRVSDTYDQSELDNAGYSKLKAKKEQKHEQVEHQGDSKRRMKEFLK